MCILILGIDLESPKYCMEREYGKDDVTGLRMPGENRDPENKARKGSEAKISFQQSFVINTEDQRKPGKHVDHSDMRKMSYHKTGIHVGKSTKKTTLSS